MQTTTGGPVTITVERNTDAIQSGITAFVDAYNAAVDAIDAQRGKQAGALAGQSILGSLSGILRQITQYHAGSGSQSLFSLGINLDSLGKFKFDSSKLDSGNPKALLDFLGGTSSSGFLKAASDALDLAENSSSGSVKNAIQSLDTEMKHQDDLIAASQQRIDDLTASLQARMAAADAVIASLEQQVTFMSALFQSMSSSNYNNKN
jgi:flagellar hook-associated protein 2